MKGGFSAGEGLFGFKQTWPWHNTVHKISEIPARIDLPFQNYEDVAWLALLRQYRALPVDSISASHCVTVQEQNPVPRAVTASLISHF